MNLKTPIDPLLDAAFPPRVSNIALKSDQACLFETAECFCSLSPAPRLVLCNHPIDEKQPKKEKNAHGTSVPLPDRPT